MKIHLLLLCILLLLAVAREAPDGMALTAGIAVSGAAAAKTDRKSNHAPASGARGMNAAQSAARIRNARPPLPPHLFM